MRYSIIWMLMLSVISWGDLRDVAASPLFNVEDLNAALGGEESRALATNQMGQIAATRWVNFLAEAVRYDPSQGVLPLGTLGGEESRVIDLNSQGDVLGESMDATGQWRLFLYSSAAGLQQIPEIPGTQGSQAIMLNDAGEALVAFHKGEYVSLGLYIRHYKYYYYLYSRQNGLQNIHSLTGLDPDFYLSFTGMNSMHQMIGSRDCCGGFLYDPSQGVVTIPGLGGGDAVPTAINALGEVVGHAPLASGVEHGFMFTLHDGIHDLGTSIYPQRVNAHGEILGQTRWTQGNATYELTDLMTSGSNGYWYYYGLNDDAAIVGSLFANGEEHAVQISRAPQAPAPFNPNASIQLDGSPNDWLSLTGFSADAIDAGDGATVELEKAWMAHRGQDLFFAFKNDRPIETENLWAWNSYLDIDANPASGYLVNGIGAEYLLEGVRLHRYTGAGADWSWQYLGELPYGIKDRFLEMEIPASLTGLTAQTQKVQLVLLGNNLSLGTGVNDFYPDSGTSPLDYFLQSPIATQQINLDGLFDDWVQIPIAMSDPQDVATTASTDIKHIRFTNTEQNLYVYLEAWTPLPDKTLSWNQMMYFDTDFEVATGYHFGAIGAEYLLQGERLYAYTGSGSDWHWTLIDGIDRQQQDHAAELRIGLNRLGLTKGNDHLRCIVVADNGSTQGPTDYLPDDSTHAAVTYAIQDHQAAPVQQIVVDGSMQDWLSLHPDIHAAPNQVLDDADSTQTQAADWRLAWFGEGYDNAYLAFRNNTPMDTQHLPDWQIYILTDYQAPGYQLTAVTGAKPYQYLLQGDRLYHYTGTGHDWSWEFVGAVEHAVRNDFLEMAIPRSQLGQPKGYEFVFYADNHALGEPTDYMLLQASGYALQQP